MLPAAKTAARRRDAPTADATIDRHNSDAGSTGA
jgi:hypothetical protein